MKFVVIFLSALIFLGHAGSLRSQTFDLRADDLTLEVVRGGDHLRLSMQALSHMGEARIEAVTPWTEGTVVFEGTPLARLAEMAGAAHGMVQITALNNYQVELALDELVAEEALLAQRMNGVRLEVRDKGPLWLVFPSAAHPALAQAENVHKWIWQVSRIEFIGAN